MTWNIREDSLRIVNGPGRSVCQLVEIPGLAASTKYFLRCKIKNLNRWSSCGPIVTCKTTSSIPPFQAIDLVLLKIVFSIPQPIHPNYF
jgi:hypothetical protein